MSPRSLAGLLGFLAALIGLIFLFVPVNASVGIDCGHVFGGGATGDVLADGSAVAACAEARVGRWQYSLPLLVLGGAVAAWSTVSAGRADDEYDDEGELVDEARD